VGRALALHKKEKRIKDWRHHTLKPDVRLVTLNRGEEMELRSLREAYVFVCALASASDVNASLSQDEVSDLIRDLVPYGVSEEIPMGYGNTWTAAHGTVCVSDDDDVIRVGVYPGEQFSTGVHTNIGFADCHMVGDAAREALLWLDRMHRDDFDPEQPLPAEMIGD
jgi:hypothetical protein